MKSRAVDYNSGLDRDLIGTFG